MLKQHQITRMFMCRCCNWAFPDKTSLHIHMQAMASGSPGNVSVIAKSSVDAEPGAALLQEAAIAAQEALAHAAVSDDPDAVLEGPHSDDIEAHTLQDTDSPGLSGPAAVWLANNFPRVDASGVGSLGGNLCLHDEAQVDEEDEPEPMPVEAEEESSEEPPEKKAAETTARPSPLNSLLYQTKALRGGTGAKRGLDSIFPSTFGGEEAGLPSFLKRSESPSNTSASSCHHSPPNETVAPVTAPSGLGCVECRVLKGRLALTENQNRFLESKVAGLEAKVGRLETRVISSDGAAKRHETESKALRDTNDRLHHQLLAAQEKALRFMQTGLGDPARTDAFLNDLLNATYLGEPNNLQ